MDFNCFYNLNSSSKILAGVIRIGFKILSRTTVSLDVQTLFFVQLTFSKFLSRIKENF